jgi:hypothetical protein
MEEEEEDMMAVNSMAPGLRQPAYLHSKAERTYGGPMMRIE